MSTILVYGGILAHHFKEGVKEFWKKEKGGSEIIATMVLIAIVILLAVLFKEQISILVSKIWSGVMGKAGSAATDPITIPSSGS